MQAALLGLVGIAAGALGLAEPSAQRGRGGGFDLGMELVRGHS